MISFSVSGKMLREMLASNALLVQRGGREFYQWNAEFRVEVFEDGDIGAMTYRGVPMEPDHTFRVAMQEYHYGIMADTFGVPRGNRRRARYVVSTSAQDNVIGYFKKNKIKRYRCDGRIGLKVALEDR